VTPIHDQSKELTMLWINVMLAIPFVALWAGIPLWLVLRRPDTKPALAAVRR